MSDEQSFLDTLAANPADDTTRLVYADWLDDRGDAAKAEYLRLVVALSGELPESERERYSARLSGIAIASPAAWRAATAGCFSLVLTDIEAGADAWPIRALRSYTGIEFDTAIGQLPVVIESGMTFEDAECWSHELLLC